MHNIFFLACFVFFCWLPFGLSDVADGFFFERMTIVDAADHFGISETKLKKLCRKHGLQRWPCRDVQNLRKKVERIDFQLWRKDLSLAQRASLEHQKKACTKRMEQLVTPQAKDRPPSNPSLFVESEVVVVNVIPEALSEEDMDLAVISKSPNRTNENATEREEEEEENYALPAKKAKYNRAKDGDS